MHVSVATLTALHLHANTRFPAAALALFVAISGLSCLFTKQHYIVDVPPGFLLGWLAFRGFLVCSE